jgi:tetratricopeptide (TPR) repeat protein
MEPKPAEMDATSVLRSARKLKASNEWEALVEMGDKLPDRLEDDWLAVADEVAFAYGHLGITEKAVELYARTFSVEPTYRRASALAYVYYDALMQQNARGRREGPRRDAESDRKEFQRWIGEALRRRPGSVKDLYRMGVYEAQIQTRHDAPALRIFRRAINAYRSLDEVTRRSRHDLAKPFVRSLYGAARSAYRLGRFEEARHWIFTCIRQDEQTDYVAPLFKLYLAGKVCAELDMPNDAERAFRLALDAKGPPSRNFVFSALAKLAVRCGRLDDAETWIEKNIGPHRRSASDWRLLGDIARKKGDDKGALAAFENALKKDRAGRHLTLVRIGDLNLESGKHGKARRSYQKANKFRKRKYLSDDPAALEGLLRVAELRGDEEKAAELRRQIQELRPFRKGPGSRTESRHESRGEPAAEAEAKPKTEPEPRVESGDEDEPSPDPH